MCSFCNLARLPPDSYIREYKKSLAGPRFGMPHASKPLGSLFFVPKRANFGWPGNEVREIWCAVYFEARFVGCDPGLAGVRAKSALSGDFVESGAGGSSGCGWRFRRSQ